MISINTYFIALDSDTSIYWYLELNFYLFIYSIKDINEMNNKCPDVCVKVMDNNKLIYITLNRLYNVQNTWDIYKANDEYLLFYRHP